MNKQIIQKLRSWADQYETSAFISSDPVQLSKETAILKMETLFVANNREGKQWNK